VFDNIPSNKNMAKNNTKDLNNTTKTNSAVNVANEKEKTPKVVSSAKNSVEAPAPKEESHGGWLAIVLAALALIIIGISVVAFVLFFKTKNKYNDLLNQTKNNSVNSELSESSDFYEKEAAVVEYPSEETSVVGIGETSVPAVTETPVVTETPPPVVPDIPEEPEKVDHYNFDSAIAEMDNLINQTSEETFPMSYLSDSSVGF